MISHFQIAIPEQVRAIFYEDLYTQSERQRMTTEIVEVQHRLIDVEEGERMRLAREIHDGPLQELHSLDFELIAFARQLEDEQAQTQLAEMRRTLHHVSRTLRTLCQKLRPPALAPFGLAVVIRSFADNFQLTNPEITVQLDLTDDGQILPERVRLALYRICQHALDNIQLHAQATQVLIRFMLDAEQAVLSIEDNGQGFCLPDNWFTFVQQGRVGLVGCKERAEAVGGNVEIFSAVGQGVKLTVTVPTSEDFGHDALSSKVRDEIQAHDQKNTRFAS